ncbi:MAG: hypothetical protein JWL61_5443 [Gemmatimonadetes bacterium]|nr:hypothetical protein [Gemmatimonadota bacterium]
MSLDTLEQTLNAHPEWREPMGRVLALVGSVPPGTAIDPEVVAHFSSLTAVEVLAYFHVLEKAHIGKVLFRTIDPSGLEVRRYDTWGEVPVRERDEFGDEFDVEPELVELIFSADATA